MKKIVPQVVRLRRMGTQLLVQGCDVYIGDVWKQKGWNFERSKWHNPFRPTQCLFDPLELEACLQKYEQHIRAQPDLMEALDELSGQVLGCWCKNPNDGPGLVCHGDVLVNLWKDKFPNHVHESDLWKQHFFPNGIRTTPKKQGKKRLSFENSQEPPPHKKPRIVRPLRRTPETHPLGIRHEKMNVPWPPYETAEFCLTNTLWIDEAGMGSWAGPLHVAGVVLLPGFNIQGLHDSKLLKEKEREALFQELTTSPFLKFHVAVLSNEEIDEHRLGGAWRRGVEQVVTELSSQNPQITQAVLDGDKSVSNTPIPVTSIPKADRLFAGVAAASVLAKVSRDHFMTMMAPRYPNFQTIFEKGKGYAHSAHHRTLIESGEFTDLHRKSFHPLKAFLTPQVVIQRSNKETNGSNLFQNETTTHTDISNQ